MLPIFNENNFKFYIKREDQIHPTVSGNKFRKLKYNIKKAKEMNKQEILTFGGAHSNHLLATAFMGKIEGLKTYGIIRGEELKKLNYNSTLKKCQELGMKFIFISRDDYRKRNELDYTKSISDLYTSAYVIPEGGTNELGVLGCQEILSSEDSFFDVICCPVGSGGTISGIINSSNDSQQESEKDDSAEQMFWGEMLDLAFELHATGMDEREVAMNLVRAGCPANLAVAIAKTVSKNAQSSGKQQYSGAKPSQQNETDDEQEKLEYYRAFIGKTSTDYYLDQFQHFDSQYTVKKR
mgnify:CR=1 FL=1